MDGVKTESVHVILWPMLTLFSNNIQFYVVHATIASLQPCGEGVSDLLTHSCL